MSMMSLRLPKSMYGDLKEVAKVEGVSMNQFVTIAIAEKIASSPGSFWRYYLRQEPYELAAHVRICAEGAG